MNWLGDEPLKDAAGIPLPASTGVLSELINQLKQGREEPWQRDKSLLGWPPPTTSNFGDPSRQEDRLKESALGDSLGFTS